MHRVSLASSSYTTVSIVAIVVNILLMASKMTAGILFGSAGVIFALGSVSIQAPSLGLESATTTITMPLALSPTAIGGYFVLVLAVSLLVSYLLARRTAAIKPSENLRN